MSRYRASSAYGHKIEAMGQGDYRLHWTVDRYYSGSRLRFPTGYSRWTDFAGAVRFAKRHDLAAPEADTLSPPMTIETMI